MRRTVEAIERELTEDGFVLRYRTDDAGAVDGLTGREGAFLACSFWLADCLHLIGRTTTPRRCFERLLGLRNDLGLLVRGVRRPWPVGWWATSRRPSPTCRSSTRRSNLSGPTLALVDDGELVADGAHAAATCGASRSCGRVAVRTAGRAAPSDAGQPLDGTGRSTREIGAETTKRRRTR